MCNIAGYIGEKNAAPILIDMIKKQEMFDGGCCTGIATIFEGKIYMRKVLGDVQTLIDETDALLLPGKIGIAHTRPMGDHGEYAHPFIADNGKMALVENGTLRDVHQTSRKRNALADMIAESGITFSSLVNDSHEAYPHLKTGETVSVCELEAHIMADYKNKGFSIEEAMVKMMADIYSDIVSVIIHTDSPENIYVTRNSRPMHILSLSDETYIASTQFAFPKEYMHYHTVSLPPLRCSRIFKGGYEVTPYYVEGERIAPLCAETYFKAYQKISKILDGKKGCPLCYDDIENYIYFECSDIWCEPHTLNQCASISYEILFALEREGRLKHIIKTVGNKKRDFMYI